MVALVTATLGAGATVRDALRSVEEQSVSADHIVVDGGSRDSTLTIVEQHRQRLAAILVGADRGIYDALNKGIARAQCPIVGTLHADDLLADDRVLSAVLDAFSESGVDAVYGDLEYVHRHDTTQVLRRWRAGEYAPTRFYHGWMPPHPTFFVRRSCFDEFGSYRLDLGTAADYELMLRFMLVHGIRVKYIPRVLVRMRVGGASTASLRARLRANRMDRKAWAVNGLRPYPWTLVAKPLRKIPQWWVR